jgi:hypothetical protein
MVKDPRPRRVTSSPYSRTGLFPWGNTYDVPARRVDRGYSSQTPCHLRNVRLAEYDPAATQVVRCPACGRVWTVRIKPDQEPPIATWTA